VQISLGGVITLGYELLSGAIGQQTFYLWTENIKLALARTFWTTKF